MQLSHPSLGGLRGLRRSAFAVVFGLVALSGCDRGYIRPEELERDDRGPRQCSATCQALGMRMGALVLIEDSTPACVCEPIRTTGSASTQGSAGAAGGHVVIAAAQAAAASAAMQQQRQASAYRR